MLKRCNVKIFGLEYTNCILIEDLKQYGEYLNSMNNKFEVAESEIKNLNTFIGHGHSWLTGYSGMFSGMIHEKENREPMLAHLKYLQSKTIIGQLECIMKGYKLIINDLGGYFPIRPTDECEISDIQNQIYTKADISVKKWYGGKHYYAKVGKFDVVIDGVVKWSTEQKAYDKAVEFMENLNK